MRLQITEYKVESRRAFALTILIRILQMEMLFLMPIEVFTAGVTLMVMLCKMIPS
jgi:hypothetical protein